MGELGVEASAPHRLEHENLGGLFAAVDLVFHRVALHARGSVDGIAEEAVARVQFSDNGGHDGSGVEAHADAHRAERRVVKLYGKGSTGKAAK